MNEPKVLIFTCSFQRPHMLRQCMFSIKNQSYRNIYHSINVTYNKDNITKNYDVLYDDLFDDTISLKYSENSCQYKNYVTAITNVTDYETYDLFIKVDDDDIYKKDYVKNIIQSFQKDETIDILSSKAKYQLNGYNVYHGLYRNLGGNPEKYDFMMPPTFAFNKKALDCIIPTNNIYPDNFEDIAWRNIWAQHTLIHKEVDNTMNWIWHIHGKNISTSNFLVNT